MKNLFKAFFIKCQNDDYILMEVKGIYQYNTILTIS
jgi:hypothetical protein